MFLFTYPIIFAIFVGLECNALFTDCTLRGSNTSLAFDNYTSPLNSITCTSNGFVCVILSCFISEPIAVISLFTLAMFVVCCCCLIFPSTVCGCVCCWCSRRHRRLNRRKSINSNIPVILSSPHIHQMASYQNSVVSDTVLSSNVNQPVHMSTIRSSNSRVSANSGSIVYESFKFDGRSQMIASSGSDMRYQAIPEKGDRSSYLDYMSPTSTTSLIVANDYMDKGDEYRDNSAIYEEVSDIYMAYEKGENLQEENESLYQKAEVTTVLDDYKTAVIVLNCAERNKLNDNYDAVFTKVPGSHLGRDSFFKQKADLKIPPKDLSVIYDDMSRSNFREINRKTLSPQKILSQTPFYDIFKGNWASNYGDIPVAIRVLNDSENGELGVSLLREATVMGQFDHPNILKLFGVVTLGKPFYVITEAHKDQLDTFLFKLNKSSIDRSKFPTLLHKFCIEICQGMEYLSRLNFIHRDLACRNIYITINLSCRIADFGMCRELKKEQEYHRSSGTHIPVRWTAPESVFYQRYSDKSDVWSYGMTMYEIWGMSLKPWFALTTEEVVDTLLQHKLPTPPTGCPMSVYELMIDIWDPDPENRPNFSGLLTRLKVIKLSKGIETDQMNIVGNEPSLSKGLYLDLQQKYKS